jgi:hypothetical protein
MFYLYRKVRGKTFMNTFPIIEFAGKKPGIKRRGAPVVLRKFISY